MKGSQDTSNEDLATFLVPLSTLWQEGEARPTHQQPAPSTRPWRTRADPLAKGWPEVKRWLMAEPEVTAKTLFPRLQEEHLNTFSSGQLRTLQRRVRKWRQEMARRLIFGAEDPEESQAPISTGEEVPATADVENETVAADSVPGNIVYEATRVNVVVAGQAVYPKRTWPQGSGSRSPAASGKPSIVISTSPRKSTRLRTTAGRLRSGGPDRISVERLTDVQHIIRGSFIVGQWDYLLDAFQSPSPVIPGTTGG